jgi:Domain of unknown function (DUF4123)
MSLNPQRPGSAAKQQAIDLLWQQAGRESQPRYGYLWAILDAARDKAIWPVVRRLARDGEVTCLYQGRAARELARVAPYLVSLGTDDRVFDWIWNEGWGQSWGIFLWSLVSMDSLRNHFRRMTYVSGPDRQRLLFRFYDPRVLRVFAPRCEPAQIRELFGPVTRFMMEDEDGGGIVTVRPQTGPDGERVVTTIETLSL